MALLCPNINNEDWKYSVEKLGEDKTLYLYDLLGQQIPSKEIVNSTLASEGTDAKPVSRKLEETREEFIARMNSRIEDGMYKQKDGVLVPITNNYNPETWWVERIEKLVTFAGSIRNEVLFTFNTVNKKLQELVARYSTEGYSFRRINTYVPPVGIVKANPAPNSRKIWKIEVTKPLTDTKFENEIFTLDDVDNVVADSEEIIGDFFTKLQGKSIEEIIKSVNELEVSAELKKFMTFLTTKLADNPTLNIEISDDIPIERALGSYDPWSNTIKIYREVFVGKYANFEEVGVTFAHEILHSFTYRALANNYTPSEKEFYTTIKRLYGIARVRTKVDKRHPAYAMTDDNGETLAEARRLTEFISQALTSKYIQNDLKQMELNVWDRFIAAIKSLFRIKDNVYDYVLANVVDYIEYAFVDAPIRRDLKVESILRSLDEDVYLQKDNPTHKSIWQKLNNFAKEFTVNLYDKEYTHTETGKQFVSNQEQMNHIKVTNGQLSDDPATKEKQLNWRKRIADIANVINVTASSDLSKIVVKVADANGLGRSDKVLADLTHILKRFKKPGNTILANVVVADTDIMLADTIDMVIIDENNSVHIYNFENRQYGFADWLKKTSYGKSIPYSDRQRASYRLSAQSDYFEKMTGIKVATMNVVMLHTPVVNGVITGVSLDSTHAPNGIDTVPYNASVYTMYKNARIRAGITETASFNEDKIDVETYDSIAEEEKERLKIHASLSKQLSEREEMVNKSIEALIYKKQLLARRGKSYEIEKLQNAIEDLLAEQDTEKAIIKILEFANRESKRIWNEYQRYVKSGKEIPLNILYGWRDAVSAFDAIMDEEDGLKSLLSREQGFTNGPEYRGMLSETMDRIATIKSLYEKVGIDRIVDFLSPYYNKLYAELRRNKQKEYKRKKFKGEIPAGITEQQYVDKSVDEQGDDLEIRTKNLIRSELKKAGRDIGVLTRWIDNLLDSTDPVTAAMVRAFAYADEESRVETLNKRDEFVIMLRKLETDFKQRNGRAPKSNEELYGFMLERDDKNNLTGNYITSYTSEMINEYRSIVASAKDLETQEERKPYIQGWLDENMPLQKTFRAAYWSFLEDEVNKVNGVLSQEAFKYLQDQTYLTNKMSINQMIEAGMLNEEEGTLISSWLSEHTWEHRQPIDKWRNPQWTGLQKILDSKEDVRGEFYTFIVNSRREADRFIPYSFRLDTRLPGIIKQNNERIKSGQSITQMTINSLKDDFTFRVDDTHRVEELTDEAGNAKYFLPVHFTRRITKEIEVITPEGIKEKVRVFDPEEQSFDIAGIYYKYWSMANDYSHKAEILPEMELAKFMIDKRHAIKHDLKGNVITRTSSTVSGKLRKGSEVVINKTQLADQVHDWFLSCVYGQTERDAGQLGKFDVGKFIQFLNKYTAINLLGVNFVAGTANVALGETLERIEGIAKEYVTPKDWIKSDKWYFSHMRGTIADIGARSPHNVSTKLYEWLGVLDDYGVADMDRKTRFGQLATSDTLFFTSHFGEHYMQNRFALALLNNLRAYDNDGKDIGSILDMVQLDDKGKLTFDSRMNREKSKWTDKDILAFKQKARGILSRLNGEYSKLGKVAIERMAIGRMAYMFRKFIVPGFRRRWGREYYYERLGQFAEGSYITTGKFMGNIGGKIFGKNEENSEDVFFQRLMGNLQSFKMSIISQEWSSLSDHERANIVRTISEVGFLIIAVIMANIAMGLRGDSDDPDEERFWAFIAYQAYRLQNELLFFTPKLDSAMSILRSPAASISVLENIIKLTGQVFHPMDVYESGAWKGRPKILKTLMNMTPVERQYYRLRDITDQVTFVQNAAIGGGSGGMAPPGQ